MILLYFTLQDLLSDSHLQKLLKIVSNMIFVVPTLLFSPPGPFIQHIFTKISKICVEFEMCCAQGCGSVFIFYGPGSGSRA
jgi:hypothetical protein